MKKATPLALEIAGRLTAIRAERGLSVPLMAESLGVARNRYYNWEHGDNLPSEEAMIRLCNNSPITMDYIYRGVDDHIPTQLALRLRMRATGVDPDKIESASVTQLLNAFLPRAKRRV